MVTGDIIFSMTTSCWHWGSLLLKPQLVLSISVEIWEGYNIAGAMIQIIPWISVEMSVLPTTKMATLDTHGLMASLGAEEVSLGLSYRAALHLPLPHRAAPTFSCHAQNLWQRFLWRRNLGHLTLLWPAEHSSQPKQVHSVSRAWWRRGMGQLPKWLAPPQSRWSSHTPSVFFGVLRAPARSWHFHLLWKAFSLNILSAIFSRPLKNLRTIVY